MAIWLSRRLPVLMTPRPGRCRWPMPAARGSDPLHAAALPTAKVYKSFNTVGVEHMKEALGKDMMIAGDGDEASLKLVEEVVASLEDAARSSANDDGSDSVVSDLSFCNVDDSSSSAPRPPTNKTSLLRRLMRYKEREARMQEESELDLVV